jgi:hypothetical protein
MPEYHPVLSEGQPTTTAVHNPALHLGNMEGAEPKEQILDERNRLQYPHPGLVIEELLRDPSERTRM